MPDYLIATFVPAGYGFRVAFLLPDAQTAYGRVLLIRDEDALLKVVEKLSGDTHETRRVVHAWGQGSTHVSPSGAQCDWLRDSCPKFGPRANGGLLEIGRSAVQ